MILAETEKFTLRKKITDYAKSIGFDLVGFSPAKIEEKYLKAFEDWLGEGREGTMEYMRKIEQRRDLTKILPGAKSVIVFGMNYYREQPALPRGHGRVARYAYGRDYHKVIGKKLKMVEKFIAENCASQIEAGSTSHFLPAVPPRGGHVNQSPPLTKSYVDTGPLMERALAEQSGIGRIGKNGCVISKEFGSWIFLSEIITTIDLSFESAKSSLGRIYGMDPKSARADFLVKKTAQESHSASTIPRTDRWSDPTQKSFNVCGNCNKCMTACPTGAIIAPGVVDSRLCISYLTIENKEKIPTALAKIIKKTKRLYGCDICQEVCPHNQARAKASALSRPTHDYKTKRPDLRRDTLSPNSHDGLFTPIAGDSLNTKKIPTTDATFLRTFAGSPVMRAKRKGLTRTARIF